MAPDDSQDAPRPARDDEAAGPAARGLSPASRLLHPDGRVLLLEIVNADQFPGRLCNYLPMVAGHYHDMGAEPSWIRFALSTTNQLEHRRDALTLTEAEERRLVELAGDQDPALIILTDRLHGPQLERVLAATTRGRAVVLGQGEGAELHSLLGHYRWPRYDWAPGNEAARQRRIDNVYLPSGETCGHPRRLRDNPLFTAPALGVSDDQIGCSFCIDSRPRGCAAAKNPEPSIGPRAWARRQVERLLADSRRRGRAPNALLFEKLPPEGVLGEVLDVLTEHDAVAQVQLLFAIRADLVARLGARIRRHFEEAPDSPARFGVYACGLESYSEEELERYNKATTPVDGLRAINTLRRLARDYPGRFWYTGLSFLLFSPWTTLQSLTLNYGLIRLLGLTRLEAGNMYQARLRLHQGLALRGLAQAEGLLDDAVRDSLQVMNRRKLFSEEEPWRCADPRVEPIMSLVLRHDLIGGDQADGLTRSLEQAARADMPGEARADDVRLQQLTLAMVAAAGQQPEAMDEAALLEAALGAWRRQRARRRGAEQEPFRLGEIRCDLPALATSLAGLVRRGVRRVVAVDAPEADAGDAELIRALAADRLEAAFSTARGEGRRQLVMAATAADLQRHERLRGRLGAGGDQEAAVELGGLLGVPACCAAGLADEGAAPLVWAAFARRNEVRGAVPAELLPFWIPGLAFVPCQPDCAEAAAAHREVHQALDAPPPAQAVWVLSGDGKDQGDVAGLQGVERTASGLRHDPARVFGSDPWLVERLRGADELRVLPGQLQLVRGGEVVECLPPWFVLWDPVAAHCPEFYRELARGVELVAANCGPGGAYQLPFGDEGGPKQTDRPGRSMNEAPAEPSDPMEQPLSRRQLALAEALRRVARALPAARGIHLEEVTARGEDAMGLVVTLQGARYELRLDHGAPPERYFHRTRRLALSYQRHTPLTSPDHQARLRALLDALDAALEARRRGR